MKIIFFFFFVVQGAFAQDFQTYDVYLRDNEIFFQDQAKLINECKTSQSSVCQKMLEEFESIAKVHNSFLGKNEIQLFSSWTNKNNWKNIYNFSSKLALKCDGIPVDVDYCLKQMESLKNYVQTSNLNADNKVLVVRFLDRYTHKLSSHYVVNLHQIKKFSNLLENYEKSKKEMANSNIAVKIGNSEDRLASVAQSISYRNYLKVSLFFGALVVVFLASILIVRNLTLKKNKLNMLKQRSVDNKMLFLRFFEYASQENVRVRFFSSGNVDTIFIDQVESDIKKIINVLAKDMKEIHFKVKQSETSKSLETIVFDKNSLMDDKYTAVFSQLDILNHFENSSMKIKNVLDYEGNVSQSSLSVVM